MSRFRRAMHGVFSSYVLLAAIAVYSLVSLPMARHYLDGEHFGLWALMGTLAGYLNLVDAGMSSAAARLLIDHKDDRDGGSYGSLIKTGWLVSLVQGAIIFLIGLFFAGPIAHLMATPAGMQVEFVQLVHWQCAALALSFATRMLNMILGAHQRMDWSNYAGILGLAINLAVQWVLFHFGYGVLSLAGGTLVSTVALMVCQWLGCDLLKLFPHPGSWGRISWLHFRGMFDFGKDLFLVSVGTQLIMASQIIVITRLLGFEAAGVWSVGLRVFNLLSQIVWRVADMSAAALAEMMARGELARLRERYRSLAILTLSLSGWMAVSFAMCNSRFISIWFHGKIQWPSGNDWLLALWMVISAMIHCHNSFVLLTKRVGFMRYIYFLEGVIFVVASCLVVRWGGLAAIIVCSIVCSAAFSGAYGVWRIHRYFDVSISEVALGWFRPMAVMLLFYLPAAVLAWWLPIPAPGLVRLGFNGVLACSVGVYLLLRHGIPAPFQNELLSRIPSRFGSILKLVFVKSAE